MSGLPDTGKGFSDEQIQKESKRLGLSIQREFIGCYSKDTLPTLRDNQNAVVNIQDTVDADGKELEGTHWVATGVQRGQTWYVDSFGLGIPLELKAKLRKPIYRPTVDIQDANSDLCGEFALAACLAVCSSNESVTKSIPAFLSIFQRDKLRKNDKILREYLIQHESSHQSYNRHKFDPRPRH